MTLEMVVEAVEAPLEAVQQELEELVERQVLDSKLVLSRPVGAPSPAASSSHSGMLRLYFAAVPESGRAEELSQRCQALVQLHEHLQGQLAQDTESQGLLEQHMDRLHRYNQAKDSGQVLLGVLANIRGVCIRDLYQEFSLKLAD